MVTLKTWLIFLFCIVTVSVGSSEARSVGSLELDSLSNSAVGHEKEKRFYFNANCFGIYDREMLAELESVCEECYNLYRKPHVAAGCRRNCFNSEVFEGCLRDLMLHDRAPEFKDMVHMVAGRK